MVPIEQVTRDENLVGNWDRSLFPASYTRDFDTLTLNAKSRKTFFEVIPEDRCSIHHIPLQENSRRRIKNTTGVGFEKLEVRLEQQQNPWDPDCQWSINIMREGPPAPTSGHIGYWWSLSTHTFAEYYKNRQLDPEILQRGILERLMERYALELSNLPILDNGTPANRLNYPELEKWDVLQGLHDFASMGKRYADRLKRVYEDLSFKPLGETLNIQNLEKGLSRA